MLTIAVIDRRSFIIPDALNAAAAGLGVVHAVAQDRDAMMLASTLAAIRGITFALLFLAIRVAYARVRGREGLGLGDIKLAGAAGVWLDWSMMPVAIQIAAFTALAVYGIREFALGRPIAATSRLPFGLFFAPAIWICWMIEVTLWAPF
jgi:leader peptidase (prepilin peptidase)/N-methyltransferase